MMYPLQESCRLNSDILCAEGMVRFQHVLPSGRVYSRDEGNRA